jgi:hypothetical protein
MREPTLWYHDENSEQGIPYTQASSERLKLVVAGNVNFLTGDPDIKRAWAAEILRQRGA